MTYWSDIWQKIKEVYNAPAATSLITNPLTSPQFWSMAKEELALTIRAYFLPAWLPVYAFRRAFGRRPC